ncbi:hypothetical protein HPB47_003725 [Ixodes persulcatus]|uniref:Uncharacterized protein n=1 Tax=Ixodes persulcatus TaxID=34615 RepID=A0AC60PHS2_IXOPE|nr:hypothetical protein HPB47_003725 [Ixodes persulcatus]
MAHRYGPPGDILSRQSEDALLASGFTPESSTHEAEDAWKLRRSETKFAGRRGWDGAGDRSRRSQPCTALSSPLETELAAVKIVLCELAATTLASVVILWSIRLPDGLSHCGLSPPPKLDDTPPLARTVASLAADR